MQNISAVFDRHRLPFIRGLAPLRNTQVDLEIAVEERLSSWGGANRRGLESVLRENDAGLRVTLSPALHSILPQYFGTLGSTSSDHARIPPVRFLSFANPALRSCSRARALRTPERQ